VALSSRGRGRTRALVLSLWLALCALASACGGDGGPAASPSASPLQVTEEQEGIRLTLSVDDDLYAVGDVVKITAEAENTRQDTVTYSASPRGGPALRLGIISDLAATQELGTDGPAADNNGELPPGEKLRREVEWDQQIAMYQTPLQAPPATYRVAAEFVVTAASGAQAGVRAFVSIRLEGGEPVVASQVAIETALFHDEVKNWFEGRGALVTCADGNRDLFFTSAIDSPSAIETLADIYQLAVEKGEPICSAVTEGDTWRIIFSGAGPPPQRISAFLDLHDGTFLSVEEGGPVVPSPES